MLRTPHFARVRRRVALRAAASRPGVTLPSSLAPFTIRTSRRRAPRTADPTFRRLKDPTRLRHLAGTAHRSSRARAPLRVRVLGANSDVDPSRRFGPRADPDPPAPTYCCCNCAADNTGGASATPPPTTRCDRLGQPRLEYSPAPVLDPSFAPRLRRAPPPRPPAADRPALYASDSRTERRWCQVEILRAVRLYRRTPSAFRGRSERSALSCSPPQPPRTSGPPSRRSSAGQPRRRGPPMVHLPRIRSGRRRRTAKTRRRDPRERRSTPVHPSVRIARARREQASAPPAPANLRRGDRRRDSTPAMLTGPPRASRRRRDARRRRRRTPRTRRTSARARATRRRPRRRGEPKHRCGDDELGHERRPPHRAGSGLGRRGRRRARGRRARRRRRAHGGGGGRATRRVGHRDSDLAAVAPPPTELRSRRRPGDRRHAPPRRRGVEVPAPPRALRRRLHLLLLRRPRRPPRRARDPAAPRAPRRTTRTTRLGGGRARVRPTLADARALVAAVRSDVRGAAAVLRRSREIDARGADAERERERPVHHHPGLHDEVRHDPRRADREHARAPHRSERRRGRQRRRRGDVGGDERREGRDVRAVAAVRSIPPSYSDHPPPRATSTGNASAHTSATGHAAWRVTAARR